MTTAARATAATTARKLFGNFPLLALRPSFPVPLPLMLSLSVLRCLPNQRWGRKGIRPPFFSRLLRLRRIRRRLFPILFAIRLNGPGPDLTGCAGAGGSLRTNWDTEPA